MQLAQSMGVIVPSSNRIVEIVTAAIVGQCPGISAHYARVPVAGSHVHLSDRHDIDGMLTAARLLADARVDVIVWNGSKGAGLGLDADRELCRLITQATGIDATTSVLAIETAFTAMGVKRYGLVTPFSDAYQRQIIDGLAGAGFACTAEVHREVLENYDIGRIAPAEIAAMARPLAKTGVDALLILCTNLHGAPIAAALELELGIPVLDSVSMGVWGALRLAGPPTGHLASAWGEVFAIR